MMTTCRRFRVLLGVTLALAVSTTMGAGPEPDEPKGRWLQWGGPQRNFTADTRELAGTWPADGPKRLWHRPLGTGYSGMVVDDGRLYTMYRRDKSDAYEYTIALDTATGDTIWDKRHPAAVPDSVPDYGKRFTGPNATPLLVGDRLYTVGRNATIHCYRKSDGDVVWVHDLVKEFGAETQVCGYSSSPLAYGNTLILALGRAEGDHREGNSLIAFDQISGEPVWHRHTFRIEHSSPILITIDGQDQVVQCTRRALMGFDPTNGDMLWEHPYPDADQFQGIFATPVWDGKDTIMFSSRQVGCAARITKGSDGFATEELWSSRKTPLGMSTPVLIGDVLVGHKRGTGSPGMLLMAVDVQTGKRLWLERGFPMAVLVGGPARLIALDHQGQLTLATANRNGLTIHSRCQVTEQESFTAPVLVDQTLFVRDEKHIMALDLS